MNKRILFIVPLVIAVLPAVVWARSGGSGDGRGLVQHQLFAWTTEDTPTDGTRWTVVPGLRLETWCAGDQAATATVSLQFHSGAGPVKVRVVREGNTVVNGRRVPLRPGGVTMDTGTRPGELVSSSFAFAKKGSLDGHGEIFTVEWRSPEGNRAVLDKGTLIVLWDPMDEGYCM